MYITVTHHSVAEFDFKVNQKISEGFRLVGGGYQIGKAFAQTLSKPAAASRKKKVSVKKE